jgi:branched-chain amino acid transport system permease protein
VAFFVVQLLTGLAGASTLFLVAAGLTVIFGVTRVVNFAHGSLFMLGTYIAWSVLTRLPRDPAWFAIGVVASAAATALIGAALEIVLLRRIYRAPELFQLLATFGVVLIVQDLTQTIWGPADLSLSRPPWLRGFVDVMGQRFPRYDLWLIAIGPVVLAALWLLLHRMRWGTLVRAATQDRDMLAALGVDQRVLFTAVFALGSALAGLAGALMLPDRSANLQLDLSVITDAFVVVVVGGLGSLEGAALASLLIGLLQAFGIVIFPQITLVLVFLVMAVVLVLRPNGLLGRPTGTTSGDSAARLIGPAPKALVWVGLAVLALAIVAPLFAGPYALSVLTEALVAILFAAGLHLMMGPGGMPSFGHAAWFGLGAYGAAMIATRLGMPMAAGLIAAPLIAGAVACAFGWFVVRLSGVYLAMLTLAFAQIVWAVSFQLVDLTGGDNGILGVRPDALAQTPAGLYWLALALCVGGTLLLRRALYAPFGFALRASRDAPMRAEASGLPVPALRLAAFALAGGAAGLSGGVYAYAKGSVFPTYISIGRSVDALIMVLLGGVETMAGPVVGALAYTGLYDGLLTATDHWRLVLGAVIVLLVLAFPDGIAGVTQRLWQRA